jgi:hypothetical protein
VGFEGDAPKQLSVQQQLHKHRNEEDDITEQGRMSVAYLPDNMSATMGSWN